MKATLFFNPNTPEATRAERSEAHMRAVKDILRMNASSLVWIGTSNAYEDKKQSTDLKVIVRGGNVAVRVRNPEFNRFRDITFRAYNHGARTEIHKLREGHADWYLYAWELPDGNLEWVLLDVNRMREVGLLDEDRPVRMNHDGTTGFVAYSRNEVRKANVVVREGIYRNRGSK